MLPSDLRYKKCIKESKNLIADIAKEKKIFTGPNYFFKVLWLTQHFIFTFKNNVYKCEIWLFIAIYEMYFKRYCGNTILVKTKYYANQGKIYCIIKQSSY